MIFPGFWSILKTFFQILPDGYFLLILLIDNVTLILNFDSKVVCAVTMNVFFCFLTFASLSAIRKMLESHYCKILPYCRFLSQTFFGMNLYFCARISCYIKTNLINYLSSFWTTLLKIMEQWAIYTHYLCSYVMLCAIW